MLHTSYIELSKNALKKNLRYLRNLVGPDVKIVSVIKGNAYGHGIKEFVQMAEECAIDYFAVFDIYEANEAFSVKNFDSDIMVIGMIDEEGIEWCIKNNASFFIIDIERLKNTISVAKKLNSKAKIHLEVETGLHRTGIETEELPETAKIIKNNSDYLELEGLCTHYAGAESIANYFRIQTQISVFNEIKEYIKKMGLKPKYCHTACSAATILYPETRMDLVRIGIAQFGFWPSKEVRIHKLLSDDTKYRKDPLNSILTWKSIVMSIKTVKPGEFIGYGNSYQTVRKTKIAIIPIGYFHGYRRSLSNVGHVLIKGKKTPIIGMVNMSMMVVDITSIKDVKKGEEVVLIGRQGKNKITVSSFSENLNLVNYELLVRLPQHIPRIITN
ncbi:MAG: alanine racemase [Candidatus Thermoplasmatota archaeon]|nr:alanine racemase [Candidatus Thermoplasmatota archaeon]